MKNLLYIILLVFVTQLQAQKTFRIINLTANTIQIPVITTSIALGLYPQFSSKPSGVFSIAPFATFILQNTTGINPLRFPYISTPTTILPSWERKATSTATPTNLSAGAAGIASGTVQVFDWLQITNNGTTKTIGIVGSGYLQTLTSNGWTASYALSGTLTAPIYTITVQ
jgi:hypothetical protein